MESLVVHNPKDVAKIDQAYVLKLLGPYVRSIANQMRPSRPQRQNVSS